MNRIHPALKSVIAMLPLSACAVTLSMQFAHANPFGIVDSDVPLQHHRPVIGPTDTPITPSLDLEPESPNFGKHVFSEATFKACIVESFAFSHGTFGRYYEFGLQAEHADYVDYSSQDLTLVDEISNGPYDKVTEYDCADSGTLVSTISPNQYTPGLNNGAVGKETVFSKCENSAGAYDGIFRQDWSRAVYKKNNDDPLVPFVFPALAVEEHDQYAIEFDSNFYTQSIFGDVVSRYERHQRNYYLPWRVIREDQTYNIDDIRYRYSMMGLPEVEINGSNFYHDAMLDSNFDNRRKFTRRISVDSSHTIKGCYHFNDGKISYLNTTVKVEYPDNTTMISPWLEVPMDGLVHDTVHNARVVFTASDGSSAEVLSTWMPQIVDLFGVPTQQDVYNATVKLTVPFKGTTTLSVPWSELLP